MISLWRYYGNPQTLGESVSLHRRYDMYFLRSIIFNLAFMLQSRMNSELGLEDNQYTRYYCCKQNWTSGSVCEAMLMRKYIEKWRRERGNYV